jgi:hypothetical protein
MTLQQFKNYLKKINPDIVVRQRGYGDIGGIFVKKWGRNGYVARITRGELTMNGYRTMMVDPSNPLKEVQGIIQKRGRKTLINLLRNRRLIKGHKAISILSYGIKENTNG